MLAITPGSRASFSCDKRSLGDESMRIHGTIAAALIAAWSCLFGRTARPVRHYHPYPFDP
jgi:hypothetical protein